MPTGSLAARVVKQPLADVLPDRMLTIHPDRVRHLDLDRSVSTAAGNPQHLARNLRKPALLNGDAVRANAGVFKYGPNILPAARRPDRRAEEVGVPFWLA